MRKKRKRRMTWFSGLFIEVASIFGLFAIAMPEKGVSIAKNLLSHFAQPIQIKPELGTSQVDLAPRITTGRVPIGEETTTAPSSSDPLN